MIADLLSQRAICTGYCVCEEGFSDVDCSMEVTPLMPLAEGSALPAEVPRNTPTIVKADVPLGSDPVAIAAANDTLGWRYWIVTVASDGTGGATATTSPGLSGSQPSSGGTTNQWAATELPGFISAELRLPPVGGVRTPPSPPQLGSPEGISLRGDCLCFQPPPPPAPSAGWASNPESSTDSLASTQTPPTAT